jgi:hypothetical protein
MRYDYDAEVLCLSAFAVVLWPGDLDTNRNISERACGAVVWKG